ncbi:nuclear transport factor 2 family protein [Ralstonia soli]|uniref:Nuclear transport factor 2 family protein n=1 Tax=Ralstonia soli TaxID=2953896 RepID=A0ABT1AGK9_9RALS|nr:nuclear transport factor 2 family protein [Ralstonia soli]MCO5397347.1 nuclear transport factor 2 family protein [Ralstonia soli]
MDATDPTSRLLALEAQVRALGDQLAIHRLIASYGPLVDSAVDAARSHEAAALWTEDGIYDLGPDLVAQGRAAIAALFMHDVHQQLIRDGSAHVMGLPLVELDGDRALVLSYSRVYRHTAEGFTVWRVSANRWELVREPSAVPPDGSANVPGWRIARRVNRLLDGSAEAQALLRPSASSANGTG